MSMSSDGPTVLWKVGPGARAAVDAKSVRVATFWRIREDGRGRSVQKDAGRVSWETRRPGLMVRRYCLLRRRRRAAAAARPVPMSTREVGSGTGVGSSVLISLM